jgi:hypothetical protein
MNISKQKFVDGDARLSSTLYSELEAKCDWFAWAEYGWTSDVVFLCAEDRPDETSLASRSVRDLLSFERLERISLIEMIASSDRSIFVASISLVGAKQNGTKKNAESVLQAHAAT